MLSALILLKELKWIIPTTFMIGVAPAFLTAATLWKFITAPFPHWVFVIGDDFLFSTYHRQLLFYFEIMSGIEMIFYGDSEATQKLWMGENCIYISNHQSTVDWVLGSSMAHRRGALGRIRYVLKDGLRFLPWYGFYFRLHGSIFVKRGMKYSKGTTEKQLECTAKNRTPMWLVLFPEGTRYNLEMMETIKSSKEFAKSRGLAPFESVLFPRTKAMQACLEQLKGSLDCVYNVTLAYGKTYDFEAKQRVRAPTMQDVLLGLPKRIHIHVKRIPIAEVPHEESQLNSWLYEQFQEKDRLLQDFYKAETEQDAKFPGPSKIVPLSLKSLLPSVLFWSGGFVMLMSFKEARDMYGKIAIGAGTLGILWMAVRP